MNNQEGCPIGAYVDQQKESSLDTGLQPTEIVRLAEDRQLEVPLL